MRIARLYLSVGLSVLMLAGGTLQGCTSWRHRPLTPPTFGAGKPPREVRVTRYSPVGTRSREQSLVELGDGELARLFGYSQPSDTSPEADYTA